ncbi:multidrug efflux transporter AcrB transmembrane domain-containing protein [Aspergillus heteromorphus CBS 117.55]|uniref:Multidrug efflux transporter AcrB transmembrane domain-containing protein n=1 Tax=Aspergillus heteromorphus CBS 117.55 TaxID=1448321 RepID=A0A317VC01_9EURO|nr:multidrug efflux transporter AcrB transmembrane domain-containing protein [Aspergillus heteromorphus CBS 117.55]PWY70929.1 multidrug efflux transporter AcrB transmembrane domain-containing protein [Aspergillus heteromorphus CBS 117.55]
MRGLRFIPIIASLGLLPRALARDEPSSGFTTIHEPGRCAIRGHCGKKSWFGGELPCPDNGRAEQPETAVRQKLVDLCGSKWEEGPVCCVDEQIDALSKNLKLAEGIIASCPACKENFFNIFCTFTCSPDQSLFVNVTQIEENSSGKRLVTELDNVWSEEFQSGFYDSCKNVKNGASGGKAIDFIGGGAKDYPHFMKFLGDKKLLGSPFQINFKTEPAGSDPDGMEALPITPKACNDADEAFRCSCVDCPDVCPELPAIKQDQYCHVGLLPCLSFAVILIYSIFLLVIVACSSYFTYRERRYRKPERVRLLQDPAPSDDEDEGDIVRAGGYIEQPNGVYKLNAVLDKLFNRIGGACARFPAITIVSSVIVVGVLSLGWLRFAVETDPVRLWVSPSSAAAQEKAYFDENFGPFYRAEQAFLVNDTSSDGRVLSYDTLSWWFDVESRVHRMISLERELILDDICFKPTGDACVVQSLTGYFGGSVANLDPDTWEERLVHCAGSPGDVSCLPEFGQPLRPEMILGGFEDSKDVLDAKSLITTWVVNNHPQGTEGEADAIDWEENSFIRIFEVVQEEAKERGLRVSFNAEMSVEQELNKSTNTDAKIVVISYLIMFLYASLALGSVTVTWKSLFSNPANVLVQSKFTLGIVGIVIVLMSVSASVGLFSAAGVKVTLIIAEVIPFLVLAVGVDNIFLIVHEFERINVSHPDEEIDERIARAVGRIGPSIFLSAITETIAFGLGVFVGMPAVKNFAVYAAGAVFINAVLQITMFISVLALNQRRVESLRADCIPCVTVRKAHSGMSEDQLLDEQEGESALQTFIRKVYASSLLGRRVKVMVVIAFLGLLTAGLALIPKITLGLDQRIAIPSDSYLIQYFDDLNAYFGSGPPVYFVTRNVNVTARRHQQQLCGRFTTCEEFSLPFVLEQESKRPNVSYISGSTASWIDDFFYWLNPQQDCCKEEGEICFEDRTPAWNISLDGMPEGDEFIHYVEKWTDSPTDSSCPLGGKAPYSNALVIDSKHKTTNASHFRTTHTPLRTQDDFIKSYISARRIADGISKEHNIDVFPYSKTYIFFDQYVTIVQLTGTLLGSAVAIIFLLTSALLGSVATGAVVTTTVVMTLVDILGAMAVAGVSLNAVSLVNLIICVGIAVEFCAHIARAFMFPSRAILERVPTKFRGKDARAWTALVNVGGSVFSGITVTKLLGVCVLAFTRSKIFEIYYFRVWLALVVFAATHALIFLPVALSYFGGEGMFSL